MAKEGGQFEQEVWEVVRAVPAGRVTTYGAVARALGMPGASRRVGWALNACTRAAVPVPAHRVVNRSGLLTGFAHFGPGLAMAEQLQSEGIAVEAGRVVRFAELFWDPAVELAHEAERT